MFSWFEKKINPFPKDMVLSMPHTLFSFMWAATKGARIYILLLILLATLLGVMEAFLFAVFGSVVNWLADISYEELWAQEGFKLLLLIVLLLIGTVLVSCQNWIKRQTFSGNFPMRMRWNFHRQILSQSLNFFHNEFAGRIASKIMQTSQAMRDVFVIMIDVIVYAVIYFVTMIATVGHFEVYLLLPFLVWLVTYIITLRCYIPRMAKASKIHADAKSVLMGDLRTLIIILPRLNCLPMQDVRLFTPVKPCMIF